MIDLVYLNKNINILYDNEIERIMNENNLKQICFSAFKETSGSQFGLTLLAHNTKEAIKVFYELFEDCDIADCFEI